MIPIKFCIHCFARKINDKFTLIDSRNLRKTIWCYFKCRKLRQQTVSESFICLHSSYASVQTVPHYYVLSIYNIHLCRQLQLHNGVQCLHFVVVKMSNIITNESPTKGFPLSLLLDLIGGLKSHSIIYNQWCAKLCSICNGEINKIQSHLCN